MVTKAPVRANKSSAFGVVDNCAATSDKELIIRSVPVPVAVSKTLANASAASENLLASPPERTCKAVATITPAL